MRMKQLKILFISTVLITVYCMIAAAHQIQLTGTIRDFKSSHPDFESNICGHIEGLVSNELGPEKKPEMSSSGSKCIANPISFNQWYRDTTNSLATSYTITLDNGKADVEKGSIYTYENSSFFPIDDELFGNEENSHNYHFTYEVHTSFVYEGGETFSFTGDDDLWVYIDNKLAVDVGGIHGAITRTVELDRLELKNGQAYDLDIFFAERHTSASNFNIQTSIKMQQGCLKSIVAEADVGGRISPEGTTRVPCESDASFKIIPYPGFHIKTVWVDGSQVNLTEEQSLTENNSYEFTNVTSDHTITAEFERDLCEIRGTVNYDGDWTGKLMIQSEDKDLNVPIDDWAEDIRHMNFVLPELHANTYTLTVFIDVNENGSLDTCEPFNTFHSSCPHKENNIITLRETCRNPEVCTYTPIKPEKNLYEKFSYRLFISETTNFREQTGFIQIHPTNNIFTELGAFQLKINDEYVYIYEDENLESGDAYEIEYFANHDDDIRIWFRLDLFEPDNEVKLIHSDNESNLEVSWTVFAYCPPCSKIIEITPEIWPYSTQARRSKRPTNKGNYIEVPAEGSDNDKIGGIKVTCPERCGSWQVSTLNSWITILTPEIDESGIGTGSGTRHVTFSVERNTTHRDRTGVITFTSEDGLIITEIPVYQKDKFIEAIWINELHEDSPLASEEKSITSVDENTETKFTLAVQWDDGQVTKIDSVHDDLVWWVNSPEYANINPSGILKTNTIDGQSQEVRIQACYSYGAHQDRRKTPCKTGIVIVKEISTIESVRLVGDRYIDEGKSKDYRVIATMDIEGDVNVTDPAIVDIQIEPAYAAQVIFTETTDNVGRPDPIATIKTNTVPRDTDIEVFITFRHNGNIYTNENDFSKTIIAILDKTELSRVLVLGKTTIKSDDPQNYIAKALWSNEEPTTITNEVTWSLDYNDRVYANINESGLLTPDPDAIAQDNQTVNVRAIYTYKGTQIEGHKPVLIQGESIWEINVTGNTNVDENSTEEYSANLKVDNGSPQDVSADCTWTIVDLDSAEMDNGTLTVNAVDGDSIDGFIKACYTYEGKEKCSELPIHLLDTTELTGLIIEGSATIIEDESQQYSAIALYSNQEDEDVSYDVSWAVSPADKASIDSSGMLTIQSVESLDQVNVKAVFSYKDTQREYVKSVSLIPKLKDLVIEKVVQPDIHEVDEDKTTEYLARAFWKDGTNRVVTNECEWLVDGSASVDENGLFTPQDVDGDQTVSISATFTYGKESKSANTMITIIDNHPRMIIISGTVTSTEDRQGRLFVDVFSVSDTAYMNREDLMMFEWTAGMKEKQFSLSVPANDAYNVSAFIDINLNGKLDECEAKGYTGEVTEENAECIVNLTIPDSCPVAGAAIDLQLETCNYDYTAVTNKAIESTAKPDETGVVMALIVAQNVEDLDTYQMEIEFDADKLMFVEGYEDQFIPTPCGENFLKKEGGTAVGFQAYERKPGIVNVASSLVGASSEQSPDGSGVLAVLKFKSRDRKRDINPDNIIQLKLSNVFFINSDGKNEPITRLKDGYILGSGVQCLSADFNKDGLVNFIDLNLFADHWMISEEDSENWDPVFNLNESPDLESELQIINYKDLIGFSINWLKPSFCEEETTE